MIKKILPPLSGALIITLFAFAFVSKVTDFQVFTQQIDNQPLPNSWTPVLTRSILAVEIACILLILLPWTHRAGFLLAAGFLFLFALYTILILAGFFDYIPCTCGGLVNWFGWWGHLALTVTLGLLSVVSAQLTKART